MVRLQQQTALQLLMVRIEPNPEEIPTPPHSSTHHKHPPLSYVQNFRSHYSQQNLTLPTSQQLPIRPLSGDISSLMSRSASTDFTPKKSRVILRKHSLD